MGNQNRSREFLLGWVRSEVRNRDGGRTKRRKLGHERHATRKEAQKRRGKVVEVPVHALELGGRKARASCCLPVRRRSSSHAIAKREKILPSLARPGGPLNISKLGVSPLEREGSCGPTRG